MPLTRPEAGWPRPYSRARGSSRVDMARASVSIPYEASLFVDIAADARQSCVGLDQPEAVWLGRCTPANVPKP
jgi:hypothetical protein